MAARHFVFVVFRQKMVTVAVILLSPNEWVSDDPWKV